jgi:hypothetical protein
VLIDRLAGSLARRARRADRRGDLELVVLEAIADLLRRPIDAAALDDCADRIVSTLVDLNSAQLHALRQRLGKARGYGGGAPA